MDRETKEYLQDKAAEAECWITELMFALRAEKGEIDHSTPDYLWPSDQYVCSVLEGWAQNARDQIRRIQKHIHEDL